MGKYLDKKGVSILWGKLKNKINDVLHITNATEGQVLTKTKDDINFQDNSIVKDEKGTIIKNLRVIETNDVDIQVPLTKQDANKLYQKKGNYIDIPSEIKGNKVPITTEDGKIKWIEKSNVSYKEDHDNLVTLHDSDTGNLILPACTFQYMLGVWKGTKEAYEALEKDAGTLYIIYEDD